MMHLLKCYPEPFTAIARGEKVHEVRRAVRPFAVGDTLELREYVDTAVYSGRVLYAEVTYLTPAGAWGLPSDLCVMSIRVRRPLHRECPHTKKVVHTDENLDRLRAMHQCRFCCSQWSVCFAKRYDADGVSAWGEPGTWTHFAPEPYEVDDTPAQGWVGPEDDA